MSVRDRELLAPASQATTSWHNWIGLALVLLTGVALRWVALDRNSLWYDEGFTWWVARQPLGRIIQIIRADTWPPLYYLIMHCWIGAFGQSEWAMRAQAALASTLTLGLGWALIWRILPGTGARLLAILLLAVSVVQIEFARDVRCYATAGLLVLTCLWTLMRRAEGGSAWWLLGYVLTGAALVYQHNIMWFFLASLHVSWLLWPGDRRIKGRIVDIVLGDVGIALLFAVWVPSLLGQFHALGKAFWTQRPTFFELTESTSWLAGTNAEALRQVADDLGLIHDPMHRMFRLSLFALTLGLALVALLGTRGEMRRRIWALAAVAAGPLLLAFFYSQFRQSIYIERVFSPSAVVIPVILAAAAMVRHAIIRPCVRGGLALFALAAIASSVILLANPPKEPWREAMAWLQEQQRPGDIALFQAAEGELMYDYFAFRRSWQHMTTGGIPRDFRSNDPPRVQLPVRVDADLNELRQRLASPDIDRVWVIEAHVGWIDPDGLARRYFAQNYHEAEQRTWPRITITRYEKHASASTVPAD